MKNCPNCGASCAEDAVFCGNCGAQLPGAAEGAQHQSFETQGNAAEGAQNQSFENHGNAPAGENGAPHNQAGGYIHNGSGADMNAQGNVYGTHMNAQGFNGGAAQAPPPGQGGYSITGRNIALCIVFSIITCGIYGLYWMYKLNDEVNQLAGEPNATSGGMVILFAIITCSIYTWFWLYKMGERCDRIKGTPGSSNILYLVLSIFGLGIISYALMQDTINKAVGM